MVAGVGLVRGRQLHLVVVLAAQVGLDPLGAARSGRWDRRSRSRASAGRRSSTPGARYSAAVEPRLNAGIASTRSVSRGGSASRSCFSMKARSSSRLRAVRRDQLGRLGVILGQLVLDPRDHLFVPRRVAGGSAPAATAARAARARPRTARRARREGGLGARDDLGRA